MIERNDAAGIDHCMKLSICDFSVGSIRSSYILAKAPPFADGSSKISTSPACASFASSAQSRPVKLRFFVARTRSASFPTLRCRRSRHRRNKLTYPLFPKTCKNPPFVKNGRSFLACRFSCCFAPQTLIRRINACFLQVMLFSVYFARFSLYAL